MAEKDGATALKGFCEDPCRVPFIERSGNMGSVVKKRRKKISKHKHRKLLKRTRVQRRKRK
jgi:hypothetical protein